MSKTLYPPLAVALIGLAALAGSVRGDDLSGEKKELAGKTWWTSYSAATEEARRNGKLLLIYFQSTKENAARTAFETVSLADATVAQRLDRFVRCVVPADAQITLEGKNTALLKHPAFGDLLGHPGLVIVDYEHRDTKQYSYVITAIHFTLPKYYDAKAVRVALDLPAGTLTQRTMVFAVRIHPESPESTASEQSAVLQAEAESHSGHQASIGVQGHHQWESRFHRINARLGRSYTSQEVVAESWPNEGLLDAAVDCVDSWRQSPGHWSAVRRRHRFFGYDIRRGGNGIWYATGIFGQGR
jgi:hypothetical protein